MAAGRQKPDAGGLESAIGRMAGRQLHLITARQLDAAGLGQRGISHRVRRGRLHRIHRGVYATHPPPHTRNQLWLAAVLACGPGAMLSHEPGATLQGFLDPVSLSAHVTVPTGRGRSRPGIVVHRGTIDPRDRRRVDQIPCTSADRTLIDLAPSRTEAELETILVANVPAGPASPASPRSPPKLLPGPAPGPRSTSSRSAAAPGSRGRWSTSRSPCRPRRSR